MRLISRYSKPVVDALGPWLAMVYIRFVHLTVRWRWTGREHLDAVLAEKQPVVAAFWHGRILMMPPVMSKSVLPIHVLISINRDGERIARVMRYFNGQTIRGSTRDLRRSKSDKGGGAALRAALRRLADGDVVAVTPDGPRGPRMTAQSGAAIMSAMSGTPVLPFAWATRRARLLDNWDRFMLPWPFDRGAYVVGAPIHPQGKEPEAIEAHRLAIESALRDVTDRADREVGRTPVPPA